MTFQTLKADADKLTSPLGARIQALIDSARVNADDTWHVENERQFSWDEIAMETVSSLLAYSRDRHLVNWFTRRGVTF